MGLKEVRRCGDNINKQTSVTQFLLRKMAPTTASASNDEVAAIIKSLLDKLAGMALAMKSQTARPSTAFASYDRDEVRTQLGRFLLIDTA